MVLLIATIVPSRRPLVVMPQAPEIEPSTLAEPPSDLSLLNKSEQQTLNT
jgi:hypothetical protein